MLKRLLFANLLLFAVAFPTGSGRAQDAPTAPPQLGIRPVGVDGSYFSVTMEPGDEQTLTVELGNYGDQPALARTYAADARTRVNGGLEFALDGEAMSGATLWLDYPAETLELDAGMAVERTLSVRVPEDASPGEYLAGLVVQTADPVRVGGNDGLAVNQVIRQAISVAVDVPGPRRPSLEIGEASYVLAPASAAVRVEIRNTGNVRVKPVATLVLRNVSGAEVARAEVAMESVYAGTETYLEVGLLLPLATGDYSATVGLVDVAAGIEVAAEGLPFAVDVPEEGQTSPVIALESLTIAESRDASGALQYVEGIVAVHNHGAPVAGATLTLHVLRDGVPVEDFVLGASLSFPGGPAEFRQRYIPPGGWASGTYAFAATLTALDPATGEVVELASVAASTTVTVP